MLGVTAGGEQRPLVVMLLDNHYGPDPRVALELGLLRRRGIDVEIVAWDRRVDLPDTAASETNVIRIHAPAPSGGHLRTTLPLARFGAAVWRRRKELFDRAALLVVHDVYLLPIGWLLARALRIPFVYDAHEDFARMEAERYPKWLLQAVTALESRLAKDAVAVAVPGTSRAARWHGLLKDPPIVLPNLVQLDAPHQLDAPLEWDLIYAGTISEVRRLDLLIELARSRPELRVGVAGRGRGAEAIERAAQTLPNLEYLGWREDTGLLFSRTRAIYYGLDPTHPYSDVACPNTLYQALLYRRPLLFFCGGEPAQLAQRFRIGIRCEPTVAALEAAIAEAAAARGWEFAEAWREVVTNADPERFVRVVETACRPST